MSYRSDVRFRLLKDDYKELEDAYITELGHDTHYTDFWHNKDIYKDEGYTVYFGWNDTKWYMGEKDFEYAYFIMDYVLSLTNYSYAIIGEELEDNDIDCRGDIVCISIKREFEDDTRVWCWRFGKNREKGKY